MKINNKDKKKLIEAHKSDTEQIYTMEMIIARNRPALLIGVTELIDEKLYNVIKDNLTSLTHRGKIEVGGLEEDRGVVLRMAFTSPESANIGVSTLLDVGHGITTSGVKEDKVLNPRPRPELTGSLSQVKGLLSDDFPILSNLVNLKNGYSRLNKMIVTDPMYARILNNARLVPQGYTADVY